MHRTAEPIAMGSVVEAHQRGYGVCTRIFNVKDIYKVHFRLCRKSFQMYYDVQHVPRNFVIRTKKPHQPYGAVGTDLLMLEGSKGWERK